MRTARKYKLPPPTANATTKAVLSYLSLRGWVVWRQNNTPVWDVARASKELRGKTLSGNYAATSSRLRRYFRKNSVGKKGVADIIGFNAKTSRFIAVEVKSGKDRLSAEQERFLWSVRRAGGVAIVAKSFDDFMEKFKAYEQ